MNNNQNTPPQPPHPAQPDPCPPCRSKAQAIIENIKLLGQALKEYKWLVLLWSGWRMYNDIGPVALAKLAPLLKALVDLIGGK